MQFTDGATAKRDYKKLDFNFKFPIIVLRTDGRMARVVLAWIIVLAKVTVCLSREGLTLEKCSESTSQKNLNSFLWMVKRSPPAYFFGTIHVPYTRVWDYIPQNSKDAFENSQNVYFELDLTNPNTMRALMKCQLLPKGRRLQQSIPPKIFKRLKSHLRYIKRKLPHWLQSKDSRFTGIRAARQYANKLYELLTKDWERKRPIWVMLMVNSLSESDIKNRGIPVLDQYLALQASRNQKFVGAVEDVQEQCRPLNSLNTSQVIFALNQSLQFQERLRRGRAHLTYSTDDLIDHYNCGDLKTVLFNTQSTQISPLTANSTRNERDRSRARAIDKYFKSELIYQRNIRMAQRVIGLLRDHPEKDFFFAFGAGHFLGNHSIVDIMQKEGYDVEYVTSTQNLPSYKAKKSLLTNKQFHRKHRGCRGKRIRRRKRKRCEKLRRQKKPDYSRVRLIQKVSKKIIPSKRPITSDVQGYALNGNSWSHNGVSRPRDWTSNIIFIFVVALNCYYGIIR